jgi:hypothetical protein
MLTNIEKETYLHLLGWLKIDPPILHDREDLIWYSPKSESHWTGPYHLEDAYYIATHY